MLLPLIKEHPKMQELPSLTTKVDFQKNKLKNSLRMLKNTNNKTKKLEEKLKPKTVLKATV